jgi:hypothetical protein
VKRRIAVSLLATLVALGVGVAPPAPASASGTQGPLCRLVSNAYQYNGKGKVERTVHKGHDFRVHYAYGWVGNHYWVWGHSGESWWDDGWIIAYHANSANDNLRRGCW